MNKTLLLLLLALGVGGCSSPAENPVKQPAAAQTAPKAALPPPALAADTLATLTWESEICLHTGRYNPKRYTAAQLLGTWEVLEHSATLNYHAITFTPADIDQLSLDSLEADYTKLHLRYQQLQVVPQPVWQQLKQARLRELESEYKAKKLLIQAYTTPELLLTAPYPGACTQYVRSLAAHNDSLIRRDWEQLLRREAKRNSVPESLMARFREQLNSPDWYHYAQVDLLNTGWWNCVNQALPQTEPTTRMRQQYEQLFSQIRSECEDGD
ncbi:hypothetical protein DNI29_20955 [Hymenobacter sediminis]|uniref:hypothetical protein n=1 Tax=Hymenobacter sediminis TaxID=2218621 RepID=UPI000DA6D17A|nr:hypothetical protein [Hymenobacter sediminis]RPD44603.1 hypothetical protein DNI29_20955 [Hymenobacter sediminis]